MATLKRELHRIAKGPVNNIEDWWRLVFEEENRALYVEHEWAHLDVRDPGAEADNGTAAITLDDFLAKTHADDAGARQAKEQLIGVLRSLFEPRASA
ncbi:hypothetical protein [Methylobacterium isbiliense]|uniref:Uncharacterized protein n=1 Tax=Methylobacterium isbiliense TaxID=315478 RepID=A0ABQ4SHK1_9HYPH|nr:hypothetical protein [Methylobacterium isbiliense]MDN3627380.1 hypothetical protein [Methylobacterium isbiliense]GJE02029.1 hypothetical protein GMJLKIPL_3973 [Methylobacterium isbiliense]